MLKIYPQGAWLIHGRTIIEASPASEPTPQLSDIPALPDKAEGRKQTMTYDILQTHNTSSNKENLKIRFDAMASHDITYTGIIQTARASGLTKFPIPYVLTNCHNSLCAVGGTINEDDHMFGLSAAQKYGGIYVPAHQAVIHQYMREQMSACGRMILGSDSHTRYGALGTMAIGEGGGELAKQLLNRTYDIQYPEVIGVYLTGQLIPGVGPQDVALALIGAVFKVGFVKNKVLEFVGDGIAHLSMDFRNGIDVMTTETACLSSIWVTDEITREYFDIHHRPEAYKPLHPGDTAYYDGMITIDLSAIRPMIALPFHPSNVCTIEALQKDPYDHLREVENSAAEHLDNPNIHFHLQDKIKDGKIHATQGVIAGCAGGMYENLLAAADILRGSSIGNGAFSLQLYPSSQPVLLRLIANGTVAELMMAGAVMKTAFCGPCFGAGDVPSNNGFSLRHSTRNFPNREGSRPGEGQIASVALMDALSIEKKKKNGGVLTSACELDVEYSHKPYQFNDACYQSRVYNGFGHPHPEAALELGPNITDWPVMSHLTEHLLLQVASEIHDPVTTTDELIPSGETSSYRSNPLRLAEFTLSRKDPGYVERAKQIQIAEKARLEGKDPRTAHPELKVLFSKIPSLLNEPFDLMQVGIGSLVYAIRPGDGSAREQAASCQKVLGGWANIAQEYATKRYRSNLINWGMLPLLFPNQELPFHLHDFLFFPHIRQAIADQASEITAWVLSDPPQKCTLTLGKLTDEERKIILAGCLINHYRNDN